MRYRLIAVMLILMCAVPALAGQSPREAVVLVTMEGISLDQIAESNADFQRLMKDGCVGLMNDKTDGSQVFENSSVTIGAGTRGIGYDFSHYGFNALEVVEGQLAGLVYNRNTGIVAPQSSVVQTKLAAIQGINTYQHYDIFPGKLGSLLQQNGVRTYVYGNSDQGPLQSRNAVLIAMNTDGQADGGDVGVDTLVMDPGRPFGVRTNYGYILNAVKALPAERSFIVVEAGDGRRLEAAKTEIMPERYEYLKEYMLGECGQFLTALNDYLKTNTDRYLLIFAVPTQTSEAFETGDRLTPVIFTGTDVPPGMLWSSTTKIPGLITNVDLAPTALSFFGIKPDASMIGNPAAAFSRDGISVLQANNHRMVRTFQARVPVLYSYVVCVAVCVILTIISVLLHGRVANYFGLILSLSFLRPALMTLMVVPAMLWIAPVFGIFGTLPSVLFVVPGAAIITTALSKWVKDLRLSFAIIGLATAALAAADLLTGNTLLRTTILSYDPIAGIRFYGIGNESTGVVMGAALLGAFSLLDYRSSRRIWPVAILLGALAVLVGSPENGTNFGGTIALLFGFGYALLNVRGTKLSLKAVMWAVVAGAVLFVGVVAANLFIKPDQQTHIGRFFVKLFQGGPAVFLDTAIRKWSMNLRLMKYSVWTHFLYTLIIGLLVLTHRPVGILQKVLSRHPSMNAGFMGILVGIIAAMLTNDSGVAMAATSMLFLAAPLFLMVKQELTQENRVAVPPQPRRTAQPAE